MALSAADLSRLTAEQNQLRIIRANGAGAVESDGVTTTYHTPSQIDKRLRDIARVLKGPSFRPRFAGINLQRAW